MFGRRTPSAGHPPEDRHCFLAPRCLLRARRSRA